MMQTPGVYIFSFSTNMLNMSFLNLVFTRLKSTTSADKFKHVPVYHYQYEPQYSAISKDCCEAKDEIDAHWWKVLDDP